MTAKATPPMILPASFESRADQCQRRVLAGEDDDCRNHHADNAFADNQAGREQHAELLGGFRLGTCGLRASQRTTQQSRRRQSSTCFASADKSRGPLPSGGTRMCFVVRARISSRRMMPMPINPPIRIRLQSMSAAITPCASEEIRPA